MTQVDPHRGSQGGSEGGSYVRLWPDPRPPETARGRACAAGSFVWGGERLEAVTPETIWSSRPPSPAWVAWAHGFSWLPDLVGLGGAALAHARALVDGWLTVHPDRRGPGWTPEAVGARALAWTRAADVLFNHDDPGAPDRVDALLAHVRPLELALEKLDEPITAWPLLIALTALGRALPNMAEVGARASARLIGSLDALILPDGGAVTRAPADTLGWLADLVAVSHARALDGEAPAPGLARAIERAAAMGRFCQHADGGLAVFHGGGEWTPVAVSAVLKAAGAPERPFLVAPYSAYQRVSTRDVSVVLDAGSPAPAALALGRGHASALALEFATRGGRLLVNCGFSPDQPTSFREPVRATAAHSALVLADTSSASLDPRQGARGRKIPPTVSARRNEDDDGVWIDGVQEGYAPRFGLAHRRRVFLKSSGEDFRGEDTIFRPVEAASGAPKSACPYAIRFHLHPDVEVQPGKDGRSAVLATVSGEAWRFKTDAGGVSIEASVYLARGASPEQVRQLVVTGLADPGAPLDRAPNRVRWALQRIGRPPTR